ncbi:metallophosphoesterase [Methylobacterium sp. WL19]|uniref:metallophosphoesterase n=1 Tax=Methylobacterium sp. WL19 TaxID=2603896 RepID=UPI0011C703D9|nr:metallophosphoesterase [Methylobacterium sp. WL19]TXN33059.1 hypothetical protein FV220_03800 [Methylobacterium sp. WL19]
MTKITILHFSDIHWHPNSENDISIVINAMLRDIEDFKSKNKSIDIAIFSGDLVQSGTDIKHFEKAFELTLAPVIKAAKVPKERLFICAGNHDIDRNQVVKFMENGLKSSLKDLNSTNQFIDETNKGSTPNKVAFERLKNFNSFMRTKVYKPPNVLSNLMVQAFRFDVSGEEVGIALYNSAWRCTGAANDADRNSLIIGERNIDQGLSALEGCDIKIAVFHHPTDWLSDFDQSSVLGRLYSEFDLITHGHIHKSLPELRHTTSGSAIISQAGSLYNSREYPNSYQIIEVDTDSSQAVIHMRTFYDSPRRAFDAAINVNASGQLVCDFFARKKTSHNDEIRRYLRQVGLLIRGKESSHLDIGGALSSLNADARTTFVCPPLNTRRHSAVADSTESTRSIVETESEEVELEDLLRSSENLLIVAQREGGKTSLANHIAVLVSEGLSDKDRVPVIVGYQYLNKGRHGIYEEFNSYYKNSDFKMNCSNLLAQGDLLILVDDVILGDQHAEKKLLESLESYPGTRFILLADSSKLLGDPSRESLSNLLRIIYVKSLPRRSIREMTRRWCSITGTNDAETNDFIVKQLKENQLPRTGYMISLLIWAYQKQKKMERINEAFLLNAVIDSLLNKADFTKASRKEFDPISAEITLQEIAVFLRESNNISSMNSLNEFVLSFFKKKALDFNAIDVINQLITCGVLNKRGNDIQFKYKCFQEYFIAVKLRDDTNMCDQIVEHRAGNYSRELYLLSGLRRKNFDLLIRLKNRLETNIPSRLSSISSEEFSTIANQNVFDPSSHKKLTTIKTKKMSTDQVDNLLDAAEKEIETEVASPSKREIAAQKAEPGAATEKPKTDVRSISEFMNELSLFGSIIKNSEFDDGDIKDAALHFYMERMLQFQVFISQLMADLVSKFFNDTFGDYTELTSTTLSQTERDAIKGKMLIVMQKVLATISTLKITDDLATEKLKVTYRDFVDNPLNSSVARLFIALLMYDINQEGWVQKLKEMIDLNESSFMLDLVTDRLWHDLYTRYEPDTRRAQITSVVDHLMGKFGDVNSRKRTSRQAVEKAATLTQVRGRF